MAGLLRTCEGGGRWGPVRDVRKAAAGEAECHSGGAGPDRRRSSEKAGAATCDNQWVLR